MRTKQEIVERMAVLRAASPSTASAQFDKLDAAIEQYFTADDTLKHDAAYAIHQIALDAMNRGTRYRRQELMPEQDVEGSPTGYNDIRELFMVNGVWEEMFSVEVLAFKRNFRIVTSAEESAGTAMASPQVDGWISSIEEARAKELAGLNAVSSFCETGSYNTGLAVLFEDLGEVTSSMSRDDLMDRVYISGGFQELIEMFGMGIYVPSKIAGGETA